HRRAAAPVRRRARQRARPGARALGCGGPAGCARASRDRGRAVGRARRRCRPARGPSAQGSRAGPAGRGMTDGVAARVRSRLLADGADSARPLAERVARLVREEAPLLGLDALTSLVEEVVADVSGLGPLEPILADPDVSEVMVNGPGPVWAERHGGLARTTLTLDRAAIEHLIEKVVSPLGLRVDRASPLVDARLPDGSRVNVVVPPLAIDGPCMTIRRFGARTLPLDAFCPSPVVALLTWAV